MKQKLIVLTLCCFFIFGILPDSQARIPLDRRQYLKLNELLILINTFFDSGLRKESLKEITLRDGNTTLKLTQFDQLLDYIENDIGILTDEIRNIEFDINALSVNTYEYVRNIVESKKQLLEKKKKEAPRKIYIANSQVINELEKSESGDLAAYR